jgi:hypothetical protein
MPSVNWYSTTSRGIPEPLQFVLSQGVRLMLVPTVGFGWESGQRPTAGPVASERVLGLTVADERSVNELVERAREAEGSPNETRTASTIGQIQVSPATSWRVPASDERQQSRAREPFRFALPERACSNGPLGPLARRPFQSSVSLSRCRRKGAPLTLSQPGEHGRGSPVDPGLAGSRQ